jgi:tetrahydromethanopterin S-methyltransferase subunit G
MGTDDQQEIHDNGQVAVRKPNTIAEVLARLDDLAGQLTLIHAQVTRLDAFVTQVARDIGPTMLELEKGGISAVLFGKGRKAARRAAGS